MQILVPDISKAKSMSHKYDGNGRSCAQPQFLRVKMSKLLLQRTSEAFKHVQMLASEQYHKDIVSLKETNEHWFNWSTGYRFCSII